MPVIKIQNKLSGDNKGSAEKSISYLEKEQKFRDKNMRKNESFFNQKGDGILSKEALKKLDSNRRGLGKNDSKYYSLIISPSKKELEKLSDNDLKNYANDFMSLYAAHFDKGIDPVDLVWFGKLEHTRKYKGFKNGTSDKLPPGAKAGQFKPGDQRHIHILVRRKTEKNIKLSPLATARSAKSNLTNSKYGFDRVDFFHKCDVLMHDRLRRKEYKTTAVDFFISRYIKSKKGSIDLARKMGGNESIISQMEKIISKKTEPTGVNLTEEQKINAAIQFHLNNKYLKKVRNISAFPEGLQAVLREKFKFELSKEQLKIVHQTIRNIQNNKGKKRS